MQSNPLLKLCLAIAGAVFTSVATMTPTIAANLSFAVSGTFEDHETGLESFSGTYSFDPDNLVPKEDGTLETALSSYELTFLGDGGSEDPVTWTSENTFLTSSVSFKQVDRGTTFYNLDFARPESRFGLTFFATNQPAGEFGVALPDFTAAPSTFLEGALAARGLKPSVRVADVTVTKISTEVPEPSMVAGLGLLGLGGLCKQKRKSPKRDNRTIQKRSPAVE